MGVTSRYLFFAHYESYKGYYHARGRRRKIMQREEKGENKRKFRDESKGAQDKEDSRKKENANRYERKEGSARVQDAQGRKAKGKYMCARGAKGVYKKRGQERRRGGQAYAERNAGVRGAREGKEKKIGTSAQDFEAKSASVPKRARGKEC